jgi:hypothetical protein
MVYRVYTHNRNGFGSELISTLHLGRALAFYARQLEYMHKAPWGASFSVSLVDERNALFLTTLDDIQE